MAKCFDEKRHNNTVTPTLNCQNPNDWTNARDVGYFSVESFDGVLEALHGRLHALDPHVHRVHHAVRHVHQLLHVVVQRHLSTGNTTLVVSSRCDTC